ncbi:MAG: ABC transporter ATP-binding protein [Aestuariivirgaceae bacterium]
MSSIVVRNLRKSYGSLVALDGISFEVGRGETFALIGPNGAGKTTALEIVEGHRRRDGGEVLVAGLDPGLRSPRLYRRIGIVLQETALEPELTVKETLRAWSRCYPQALSVDRVLDHVALRRAGRQRVATLAAGHRRRLELALAVSGDPEVLVLDEPTAGLDPEARRDLWRVVAALNGEGRTILLSSADMEEVEALAGRLAILHDGRIVASGQPHELQQALGPEPTVELYLGGEALPRLFPQTLRAIARFERGWVRLKCRDPGPVAYELLLWAVRNRHDLSSLSIARPTLEALYRQATRRDEPETAC